MTFDEMDEMWHAIREKLARELDGLTPEEKARRINERAAPIAKRLGLKVVSKTSRRAHRGDEN